MANRGRPRGAANPRNGYGRIEDVNERLGETLASTAARRPFDVEQYRWEKALGRRSPSGELGLRKLAPKHKTIIALHLRCLSNRDIATVTGFDEITVGRVLRDPLSQEYIQAHLESMEGELHSLAPMAVDAVRTGLGSSDPKIQLNAVDKFFRATGRYAQAESKRETAEDVIARALARVAIDNAGALREIHRAPSSRMIDGHVERGAEGDLSVSSSDFGVNAHERASLELRVINGDEEMSE